MDCFNLFGRGVRNEVDTLGDVALQTVVASLEKLLFMVVDLADKINGLFSTADAELDRHREEFSASGLGDDIATLDARKVNEAGFNDALLTLGRPDDLLGKTVSSVGHGKSG